MIRCQRFEGRTSVERTEKSVFVIQFYCMMHEVQIFNTFLLSLTSSADTSEKEKCDSVLISSSGLISHHRTEKMTKTNP